MSALPEEATPGDHYRVGAVAWPRAADEVFAQLDRVSERVRGITTDRTAPTADIAVDELGAVGVWSAAMWTVGQTEKAPMSRASKPLTWEWIERESSAALSISTVGLSGWEYATGVSRWMLWIMGEVPVLWIPGDPQPDGWPPRHP